MGWASSVGAGRFRERWVRHVAEVDDGPYLDRTVLRARDHRRVGDGLVQIGGLDLVEAAKDLLGLGERTVGGDGLAVADPDRGGGRRRLERLAALHRAAPADVLGERVVGLDLGADRLR